MRFFLEKDHEKVVYKTVKSHHFYSFEKFLDTLLYFIKIQFYYSGIKILKKYDENSKSDRNLTKLMTNSFNLKIYKVVVERGRIEA